MDLKAFLVPITDETNKVLVSKRFKDEQGNPAPFVIKTLSAEEAQAIQKRVTKTNKQGIQEVDFAEYQNQVVAKSVVEPDLSNAELQAHYNTRGETNVLLKMLTIAEFTTLRLAVFKASDLDLDINEAIEEAKN